MSSSDSIATLDRIAPPAYFLKRYRFEMSDFAALCRPEQVAISVESELFRRLRKKA